MCIRDSYVPLWDGELYLEYHRGTYTSQARNKRNNRKMENALGQLEWLSVLSGLAGGTYQAERMHDCWETVLRDQFHDIIPGSSIHEVYEDTAKEYETLWNEVGNMQKEAADVLCRTADDSWSLMRFADVYKRQGPHRGRTSAPGNTGPGRRDAAAAGRTPHNK